MRRFILRRHQDISGVSGTGDVAQGVEFDDGTTVIHWLGQHRSTVVWQSYLDAHVIHGHNGATEFVFIDE